MALKRIAAPAEEPLTLAEAKQHLRVEWPDDDDYITSLIIGAREFCENFQNRAFITQTWEVVLDAFPKEQISSIHNRLTPTLFPQILFPAMSEPFRLPKPPLQSVQSVKYTDANAVTSTWDPSNYIVDTDSEPGRIAPAYNISFPSVSLQPINAVRVQFTCGYGDAAAVPQNVKHAMRLLIGHWYENREAAITDNRPPAEIPLGVESLLWLDRMVPV